MRPDSIILHHSLTKDTRTVSWDAIRHYHTSWKCEGATIAPEAVKEMIGAGMPVERPWSDIGYHFGIELVGERYEILTGRLMTEPGAHCSQQEMNRRSLGICFVGNFDEEPVPVPQLAVGLRLVHSLMEVFGITLGRVYGHRELAPYKSCPGKMFDLKQFRADLLATE